jgi:hypothetical protein
MESQAKVTVWKAKKIMTQESVPTSGANAQRLGLIPSVGTPLAPSVPGAAPEANASDATATNEFDPNTLLSPEIIQAVNEIYSTQGEDVGDALVNAMITDMGSNDPKAIERTVRSFGFDPAQIREQVGEIAAGFENAGKKYLSQITGDEGNEVLARAKGKFDLDSFRQVARLQFYGNSMAGYDAIAREWNRHKSLEYHKTHAIGK